MVRKQRSDDSAVATMDPPAVPSYREIIRRKILADVTSYRALVARAAAGEQLPETAILAAYETLARLGFKPGQLEQDLAAVREHAKNKTKWAEYVAKEPEARARQREVDKELEELKQRVNALRAEAHRLSYSVGMKAVGYLQRCTRLQVEHAHVLSDNLDQAVELRAAALRVDAVGVGS